MKPAAAAHLKLYSACQGCHENVHSNCICKAGQHLEACFHAHHSLLGPHHPNQQSHWLRRQQTSHNIGSLHGDSFQNCPPPWIDASLSFHLQALREADCYSRGHVSAEHQVTVYRMLDYGLK